ncbi:hypothetical protein EDD15DRAFT_2194430 [Pisolithus albus]|nr:hypothetical protein EDD15DRAFT_2194430 [Pisolithus albus]
MHEQSSGLETSILQSTGRMEEAQRTRESFPDIRSEESSEAWPEADLGVEDPDMQSHTIQLEQSDAGSHARTVFQQGGEGEEPDAVDPHSDCFQRNKQESYLMDRNNLVLPLGEAGKEGGDAATGGYSLKIEGDVSESHQSPRKRNASELKSSFSNLVTQKAKSHNQIYAGRMELQTPVLPHHMFLYQTLLFRNRVTTLHRFFQRLKSPRSTQEKERALPVIVQAAKFNNVGLSHYVIPGYGDNR